VARTAAAAYPVLSGDEIRQELLRIDRRYTIEDTTRVFEEKNMVLWRQVAGIHDALLSIKQAELCTKQWDAASSCRAKFEVVTYRFGRHEYWEPDRRIATKLFHVLLKQFPEEVAVLCYERVKDRKEWKLQELLEAYLRWSIPYELKEEFQRNFQKAVEKDKNPQPEARSNR
jgi:hypothetical protein